MNRIVDILKKFSAQRCFLAIRRLKSGDRIIASMKYVKGFIRHYIIELFIRLDRHHVFLYAGGLAFSLFICIIPLVLIILWILGNFLSSAEVEGQIFTAIDTLIPYQSYADFVKQVIADRVDELVAYKDIAGIIGFFGLFFAASSFFSSMRTTLNNINFVKDDHNLILGKLLDFVYILVIIFLFLLSTFIFPIFEALRRASGEIEILSVFRLGIFERVFTLSLSLLLLTFLFSTFYKVLPVKRIRTRSSLVGGLWAAILWVVAKEAFGFYLANFNRWGQIYGAYALLVVTAFWIYYSAIVFIIGAVIGKLYDERNPPDEVTEKAPSPFIE